MDKIPPTRTEPSGQGAAELLTSLLASVNRLQDVVSQLRDDNQSLRQEVQELRSVKTALATLQMNCGMRFVLFPKLPIEIRRYVRNFTLDMVIVSVIKLYCTTPRSNIMTAFNSMSEADIQSEWSGNLPQVLVKFIFFPKICAVEAKSMPSEIPVKRHGSSSTILRSTTL
jgi:hypothetical protein